MKDEQDLLNERMEKARKARKDKLVSKGKETYLNKKWMQQKYCIERKSLDEIAELCKVEYDVIWEALKRLKIPNRTMSTSEEIERYRVRVLNGQ